MTAYTIASISFGKDSLAMLLLMIARGWQIDEVVFYDTGMEFKAIYALRDKIMPLLKKHNIKYTELKPKHSFEYMMFEKPVCKRGTKEVHKHGYGWCGGVCRWGTKEKITALDRYAENKSAIVYIGIAADEGERIEKERKDYKKMPLVEWGVTEAQCLQHCYQSGYNWIEDGAELYSILDRVSCWCCRNKNLKELKNMYQYLPKYWEMLQKMQRLIKEPMKGYYDKEKNRPKGVFELEERFRDESNTF